jgi:NADH-ubiquinone oxidoreductase chain 5
MVFPLLLLSFGAIFVGFLINDMLIGVGTPFFGGSLYNSHENLNSIDSEFLHVFFKNLPFIFSFFGIFLSFVVINCYFFSTEFVFFYKTTIIFRSLYTFLTQK